MWFRARLILCTALLAGVASAQTATPSQAAQNDRWSATPAVAGSSNYRADRSLPGTGGTRSSPFHFKQPVKHGPAYKPPPQANDKATVMGRQRPWQNGRPPVDCALEPRDSACQ